MTSLNPQINALFAAYLTATGFEMSMSFGVERWCMESLGEGLTPEDITLSIAWRKDFNRKGSAKKSLMLYKMLMDSDARACVLNEAAEMRSRTRLRVMDPSRVSVLETTGRTAAVPVGEARPIAEVLKEGIASMNKAVDDAMARKAQ